MLKFHMTREELIKELEEVGTDGTDAKVYYDLWLIADKYNWDFKSNRLLDLVNGYEAEDVVLDKIFNMIHPEETDEDGNFGRNDEEYGCDLQDIIDYLHKIASETECHNAVYTYDSYGIWGKVPREELLQIRDKMITILKKEIADEQERSE